MATPNEQYIDALREHGLWSGPTPSMYKKPKESNTGQTQPIDMKPVSYTHLTLPTTPYV